jgi:hypothetical protein
MVEVGFLRSKFDFYSEYRAGRSLSRRHQTVTKTSKFFTCCGAARLKVLTLDRLTR